MTQKKLPRDFVGFLFYVLGWIVGLVLKALYYSTRFIVMTVYAALKRDQFKRRLRLAFNKLESDDAGERALGREELRFLSAQMGLTNSQWHKSVKVRRRMSDALKAAGEMAVEKGDLNQIEASLFIEQAAQLLFANFDRDLLTVENKPKRRAYRLSRGRTLEKANAAKANTRTAELGNVQTAESAPVIESSNKVPPTYETSKLNPGHPNLQMSSFSTQTANEWSNDEEPSYIEEQ